MRRLRDFTVVEPKIRRGILSNMSQLERPNFNSESRYYPHTNELHVMPHQYMFVRHERNRKIGGHKLDIYSEVRKQFLQADELHGSIKTRQLAPENLIHSTGRSLRGDLMRSLGAFRMPLWYTNEVDKSAWVNPYYKWLSHYTDARVKCSCGEAVHMEDEHIDCPEWGEDDNIRLQQKKLDMLAKFLVYYDLDGRLIQSRLGLTEKQQRELLDKVGLDYTRLKKAGENRTTATWIALAEVLSVPYQEIADAWDTTEAEVAERCMSEDPTIVPIIDWYSTKNPY